MDLSDPLLHADFAARLGDPVAEGFPHHSGAEPRIIEFVDQAGGVVRTGNRVPDSLAQRQILDPLGCPVGADLIARDAPDLLRVRLEEVPEEATAEAVGDPLVESGLILVRANLPLGVAQQDPARSVRTHVEQRVEGLQRIGKILTAVEDAAHPRALQEIVGQDFLPQGLDRLHLREETVAADVVAVALVDLGAGDSAHHPAFLEDDGMVRVAMLVQLIGSGQTGWSATDDAHRRRARLATKSDHFPKRIRPRLEIHHLPLVVN